MKTDFPIKKILHNPKLLGRKVTWLVELSKFWIDFRPQEAIKSQVLADFVVELTHHSNKDL